jgi:hypothetical protein
MRPTLLALTLAVAACGGVPDNAPEPERAPAAEAVGQPAPVGEDAVVPPGSRPLTAVGDLIGEYRVAGIDGTEVHGDVGLAVSIDGPRLSYEPNCAGFVWDIRQGGGLLRFERAKGYGPERQPDGSFMACAVAVSPEQRRLAEAVDAARRAWRTPSNGILLEGGGRSVLLFSQ